MGPITGKSTYKLTDLVASLQMVMDKMPELAANMAAPLANTKEMVSPHREKDPSALLPYGYPSALLPYGYPSFLLQYGRAPRQHHGDGLAPHHLSPPTFTLLTAC